MSRCNVWKFGDDISEISEMPAKVLKLLERPSYNNKLLLNHWENYATLEPKLTCETHHKQHRRDRRPGTKSYKLNG